METHRVARAGRLLTALLLAGCLHAPPEMLAPCRDATYLTLKATPPDSLSPAQVLTLARDDAACTAAQHRADAARSTGEIATTLSLVGVLVLVLVMTR